MSRSKRVIEALGANYLIFSVRALIKFIITPFFLSHLGAELMGFRSFIRSILDYIHLSEFGTKSAIIATVSKELQPDRSLNQKHKVIKFLRAGGQFQNLVALLTLLFSVFLAIWLDVFSKGLADENLIISRWCTIIFGLCMAFSVISGVYSGTLTGLQRMAQNQLFNLIGQILAACFGVFFVYIGWSLYGVAFSSLISVVFIFIVLRWRTSRLGIDLRIYQPPIEKKSMPKLFKLSGWIFLATLGGMLSNLSPRIILGITPDQGMSSVNQFALLVAVPFLLRYEANRVSVILRPGLTQLYHSHEDHEKVKRIAFLIVRFTTFLAATSFIGIWLINGPFIINWVGLEYYAGDLANLYTAILISLTVWTFGFKILLEVRFEYSKRGKIFMASGLFNVILSIILVQNFGISAVLIAGILSELIIIIPFVVSPSFSWILASQNWLKGIFKIVWLPLCLIVFWVLLALNIDYKLTSWLEIICSALIIGSTCISAGILWLWNDLSQHGIFLKIKNRFRNAERY